MTLHRCIAAGLAAIAFAGAPAAMAQDTAAPGTKATPPPVITAVAPAPPAQNLAVAKEIVAAAWPPQAREAQMAKLLATFLQQYKASVALDAIGEPGIKKILNDYLESVPALLRPAIEAFLPREMDAVASAYARAFTLQQLLDVRTFAQSPSGGAFLRRSTEVLADPDVAAVNTAYLKDIQAISAKSSADLRAKILTYIQEHPQQSAKPST